MRRLPLNSRYISLSETSVRGKWPNSFRVYNFYSDSTHISYSDMKRVVMLRVITLATVRYSGGSRMVIRGYCESHRWSHAKQKLTLRLLMSYIYGAPSKARNANVVYIWTYVWQR